LVLHTSVAEIYDRRWCVFEVDVAIGGNVPIYAAASSHFVQKASELDDVKTLEVDTEKSVCSSAKDFETIAQEVMKKGGFQRLNDAITQFRLTMFLSMNVEQGETSFCKQLLAALANPNKANIMGRVCLHAAARNADCDAVESLLKHKADPLMCDLQGDCPAHLLPLHMHERTTRLFAMLAPSDKVLAICNNAGMSVYRRFADWAMRADGGSPYLPAEAHVEHLLDKFAGTPLSSITFLRSQTKRVSIRQSCEFEHTVSEILTRQQSGEWDVTAEFCTGATESEMRASQAYVCRPKGWYEVDILFLAWGGRFPIPWTLQRRAVERLSASMSYQYNAKVTVLTFSSVPVTASATLRDSIEELYLAIQALPLREHFVIIDDTMGLATPVLWRLRSRLTAVCIMNFSSFWSDEYMRSEAYQTEFKMCSQGSDTIQSCNLKGSAKMVCAATFAPHDQDKHYIRMEVEEALAHVDETWWTFAAGAIMWRASELTEAMRRYELAGWTLQNLPIRLLCGDHARQHSTYESTLRLKSSLMPQAKLVTIHNSCYWWQLEGEKQVVAVTAILGDLLSCIGTEAEETQGVAGSPSFCSYATLSTENCYPIRYSL